MNVRKMYVIPSEYYDSLVRKSKILDDPLLTAQIEVDKEKEAILNGSMKNSSKALRKFNNLSYDEAFLNHQRKLKSNESPIQTDKPSGGDEPALLAPSTPAIVSSVDVESTMLKPINEQKRKMVTRHRPTKVVKATKRNETKIHKKNVAVSIIPPQEQLDDTFFDNFYTYEPKKYSRKEILQKLSK